MCCRLRLDLRALERRGGGLFGANPLTGSIGVVTINMPRIGLLANDEEDFLWRLDKLMDIACSSLETKRKVLERFTEANLYPYSKFYLRGVKERYGLYWNNHFSTIGLVGMNRPVFTFWAPTSEVPPGSPSRHEFLTICATASSDSNAKRATSTISKPPSRERRVPPCPPRHGIVEG
jgi:ribonucleoside-triphosphate reductase